MEEKFKPSPIPKGGLEIILKATFSITDEKRKILERMKEIVNENYNAEGVKETYKLRELKEIELAHRKKTMTVIIYWTMKKKKRKNKEK